MMRWGVGIVATLAGLAVLALVVLAAMPVAPFRERAEEALSERFGRPVTIAALERSPAFSFTPTIQARGIRVPQAAWAGTGDLATIDTLAVRIRVLDLLGVGIKPRGVRIRGAKINLVRTVDGRENWRTSQDRGSGGRSPLQDLDVADTTVSYRDLKQDRRFTVAVAADRRGLDVRGAGTVRGADVRIAVGGAPISGTGGAWPFRVLMDGPALAISAQGTMEAPLDTRHMALTMTARANDLKLVDAVVEAGLIRTQPIRLRARVRRDDQVWHIDDLRGTIGRSDIAGQMTVDKTSGRTVLDGSMRSNRLDFDDLADDAGLARAAALERAQGLKLVPNTRVDIGKIDRTDGRVSFRVDRIVSRRRPSSLTSAAGTLAIDHQLLTIAPLRIGLPRGTITGRVTVDQRGGRRVPIVTLALDVTGSSVAALSGGGDVSGRLDGRVRLTGAGSTIRAAVGRSDGSIGIVARDGALPAKIAAAMGFDAGRVLTADDGARATLRCAVVRLAMQGGRGTFAPLIVDTSASQTQGTGSVTFPAETIAATLTGAPKRNSLLRVPGAVRAGGTLRAPQVTVPAEVKSVGNILKGIGRAIRGHQGPTATDANCAALSARAIGR